MDSLKINITQQLSGLTFSLSPIVRQNILKEFPNAEPANNIFISFSAKTAFEGIYGKIKDYITPALVGIPKERLDKIPEIIYADPVTNEVLYKIQQAA